MTNTIYIFIDTEKQKPITIGKPSTIKPPTNHEEAKEFLITDIKCITEALCMMIHTADQNDYGDTKQLAEEAIISLHNMILEKDKKNKEKDEKTEDKI